MIAPADTSPKAAMCDGKNLNEKWLSLLKRPEYRRLGKRLPIIREQPDGTHAVVDGYGWGIEFARFDTRNCADLFIAEGFFHR
jgi:hypothetical protein